MLTDEARWFMLLAETENLSRTAADLHVTQPTLSRALQRLETRVGHALFDRERGRIRLNDAGRLLLDYVRSAEEELTAGVDAVASLVPSTERKLRLGFLHSLGTWLVPELMDAYAKLDPTIQFELMQDSANAVIAALRERRIDVALTSPRPTDPLLDWLPIEKERLVLAVPSTHHLASRTSIRIDEIHDERQICMQSEFGLRQRVDALFETRRLKPRIVLESAEIATIRALVAAGLGIAIVPGRPEVQTTSGLVPIPLADDDAYRIIGICVLNTTEPSPAARQFRRIARTRHSASAASGNVYLVHDLP